MTRVQHSNGVESERTGQDLNVYVDEQVLRYAPSTAELINFIRRNMPVDETLKLHIYPKDIPGT